MSNFRRDSMTTFDLLSEISSLASRAGRSHPIVAGILYALAAAICQGGMPFFNLAQDAQRAAQECIRLAEEEGMEGERVM